MTRRLSLAGQLLALQVVIICVVLVGVTAVTVAQSTTGAQEFEGRRAQAVAETLANSRALRDAVDDERGRLRPGRGGDHAHQLGLGVGRRRARRPDGHRQRRPRRARPALRRRRQHRARGPRLGGRAAVRRQPGRGGDGADPDRSAGARSPASSPSPRLYPSLLDGLAAAAPNLLTYLGLASAIGIVGSLLVARRVKRQTLGLEPTEIAGLVEHRDAMLHGIREGVVGLDLRGRVTLINDEAIRLLHIPGDALGRTLDDLGVGEEMRDALLSGDVERDRAVASAGRVLVVNRLPIASRGRPIGSVTTLRDRTELLELRRELDLTRHVTDTLRAQAHEFSNRLHTIAGLIELGESEEAVRFVHRVSSSRSEFSEAVTAAVRDPSVAALLIAKASQAAELGVDLRIAPDSALPALDDELSADVATVVGNLVDNAMEAAAEAPQRWVEVSLGLVDGEVDVVVRDSGPGVPPGMEREIFRRGVSTKAAATPGGSGARHRAVAGASGVHPPRRGRDGAVVGGSTFTATAARRDRAGGLVIGVLIVDDDFMVAKVHAGFITALEGFEVVGTASTGAQALGGGRPAAPRPGAARRLPAGHDRPRGAAPAAGRRVGRGRHRHQRGPGRRQHPQRPARRRPALPGEAVRPAHLRGPAAGLRRAARGAGRDRRGGPDRRGPDVRLLARRVAGRVRRRPRRASRRRPWSWCGRRSTRPGPTGCRPPSAARAPGWRG